MGFAWQLAERFALLPELALLTQVYSDPGFTTSNVANAVGFQVGVGVIYDR